MRRNSVLVVLVLFGFIMSAGSVTAKCERPELIVFSPSNKQEITGGAVIFSAGIVNSNQYPVEWVWFFIKPWIPQNNAGANNASWQRANDGAWFYRKAASFDNDATWYFENQPEQSYTLTIQIKVRDCGVFKYDDQQIVITHKPEELVANFAPSTQSGVAPFEVRFQDQSTGRITGRQWTFGDSQTSSEVNPSHTYQNSGTYTVALEVWNESKHSNPKTTIITVNTPSTNPPPTTNPPPSASSPPSAPPPPPPRLELNIPAQVIGAQGQEIPVSATVAQGALDQLDYIEIDSDMDGASERYADPASLRFKTDWIGFFQQFIRVLRKDQSVSDHPVTVKVFPANITDIMITENGVFCGQLGSNSSTGFLFSTNGEEDLYATFRILKAREEDQIALTLLNPRQWAVDPQLQSTIAFGPRIEPGEWRVLVTSGGNVKDGRFFIQTEFIQNGVSLPPVLWTEETDFHVNGKRVGASGVFDKIQSFVIGTFTGKCFLANENPELCEAVNEFWTTQMPMLIDKIGSELSDNPLLQVFLPQTGLAFKMAGYTAMGPREFAALATRTTLFVISEGVKYRVFADDNHLAKSLKSYWQHESVVDLSKQWARWAIIFYLSKGKASNIKALSSQEMQIVEKQLLSGAERGMTITVQAQQRAPITTSAFYRWRQRVVDLEELQQYVAARGGDRGLGAEDLWNQNITSIPSLEAKLATDIRGGRSVKVYAKMLGRDNQGNPIWDYASGTLNRSSDYEELTDIDLIHRIRTPDGGSGYVLSMVKASASKMKGQNRQIQKVEAVLRESPEIKSLFGSNAELLGAIYNEIEQFLHKPVAGVQDAIAREETSPAMLLYSSADLPKFTSYKVERLRSDQSSVSNDAIVAIDFELEDNKSFGAPILFKREPNGAFEPALIHDSTPLVLAGVNQAAHYQFLDYEPDKRLIQYQVGIPFKGTDMLIGYSDIVALDGYLATVVAADDTGFMVITEPSTEVQPPPPAVVSPPVIVEPPPSTAPTLISPSDNATETPTRPDLVWTNSAPGNTYELQVSLTPSFTPPMAFETYGGFDWYGIADRAFPWSRYEYSHVPPLANNTLYYWRVRPWRGDWSQVSKFTTFNPPPLAPSGFSTRAGDGWVALVWRHNTEKDLAGYVVYRSLKPDFTPSKRDSVAWAVKLAASYFDRAVRNGLTFYYRIIAVDSGGKKSEPSKIVSATPLSRKTNTAKAKPAAEYSLSLGQNFPNPFNAETAITYSLPEEAPVHLAVCNILGQEVAVLVSERQEAGEHSVRFDGADRPSGVYFIRLNIGAEVVETKKMLLIK